MITGLPRIALAMSADEFHEAIACFGDVFEMHVDDFSHFTVTDLGAHVAMCQPAGGSNIELMAPADPAAPLSQALNRFLDRRGVGTYALMLEAPVPDDEAIELAERGVDVLPLMPAATGRDVHPRSTHGVLIRVYPDGSVAQPETPTLGAAGLSGIVRAIVAVDDAGVAAKAWGHGLGLEVTHAEVDPNRGVLMARAHAPTGAVVELVSPTDLSMGFAAGVAEHLSTNGQGIAALTLSAPDPSAAVDLLGARGVATYDGPFGATVDLLGTQIVIESNV